MQANLNNGEVERESIVARMKDRITEFHAQTKDRVTDKEA